jgi:hypothetical protein
MAEMTLNPKTTALLLQDLQNELLKGSRPVAPLSGADLIVKGRKGVFDPHKHIKDVDPDGIGTTFLYPRLSLLTGAAPDAKN